MTPAIVGIGQTRSARRPRASAARLAAQAIARALGDAGAALEDVDGIVRFDREAAWEYDLPGLMRLRGLAYYGAVPDTPGSGPALVRLAALAVSQGLARLVIGYHARDEPRPAVPADVLTAAGVATVPGEFVPLAGGCAFVVGALERTAGSWRRPVRVLGTMQAAVPSASRHLDAWVESRRTGTVRATAGAMFRAAGIDSDAVAVACVYDEPPGLAALARDDFGVGAPPAAAGSGALDGVGLVLEAVRQVRAGLPPGRVALATGSPLEPTSAVLLGR